MPNEQGESSGTRDGESPSLPSVPLLTWPGYGSPPHTPNTQGESSGTRDGESPLLSPDPLLTFLGYDSSPHTQDEPGASGSKDGESASLPLLLTWPGQSEPQTQNEPVRSPGRKDGDTALQRIRCPFTLPGHFSLPHEHTVGRHPSTHLREPCVFRTTENLSELQDRMGSMLEFVLPQHAYNVETRELLAVPPHFAFSSRYMPWYQIPSSKIQPPPLLLPPPSSQTVPPSPPADQSQKNQPHCGSPPASQTMPPPPPAHQAHRNQPHLGSPLP